jgi:8-oxo-dGTP pyrophosphatase MutT (NUDIX family)
MSKEIELVDLVDSSGTIQKQSVPRTEVDRYPDLHLQIVIGVIFDKQGRLLVHKRAQTKKVNPGDIDHVCGGIKTDETLEQAMVRESLEETGLKPANVKVIAQGINKYKRYRYLLVGKSDGEPGQVDPTEVEWVRFIDLEELKNKNTSSEFTFVDEFFEDTDLVVSYINTET